MFYYSPEITMILRYALLIAAVAFTAVSAQDFPVRIEPVTIIPYLQGRVVIPPSPLKYQNIFVGAVDTVETKDGKAVAKQWHDYIGYAADPTGNSLGYAIVNHEMIEANDKIGDGGGMTMFKLGKKADGTLEVLTQTLSDGRTGKFFNVDFKNTVGETGMNCGGISFGNRVWTAEEWYQTTNKMINADGKGFRDTADFEIGKLQPSGFPGLDGKKIKRFENLNWMVEIDPVNAKAVRKQYNWSRQGFEAGVVMNDNKTVYLFEDGEVGKSLLTKFVADQPGDFTKGKLYFYKQDAGAFTGTWVEVPNDPATNWDIMVAPHAWAKTKGITGFTRLEWGQVNKTDGKIYITETGNDRPGSRYKSALAEGWTLPKHTYDRAREQGVAVDSSALWDYYGRVLVLDPKDNSVRVFIEGGPYVTDANATMNKYPEKHLSNPDGLGFLYVNGKTFMVIEEDLNGVSFGRMPNTGMRGTNCEAWLLDMSKEPTIDNLYRLAISPYGSEITGFVSFDDGNTVLINSQHPDNATISDAAAKNSLTFAITGLKQLVSSIDNDDDQPTESGIRVFPNPTSTQIQFSQTLDAALYDATGARVRVVREASSMDISDLASGVYYVRFVDGSTRQVVVQR
jgi:secreted PhoX family phosphatase